MHLGILLALNPVGLAAEPAWEVYAAADERGVTVFRAEVPGQLAPAFRGEKVMRVDPDRFFTMVTDPSTREDFSDTFAEVGQVEQGADGVVFYQVMAVPVANDRYYFLSTRDEWDVGGVDGYHRRTAVGVDPEGWPTVHAEVLGRHPGAVQAADVRVRWEIVPQEPGLYQVSYEVVSDPGGLIPMGIAGPATARAVVDAMLGLEAAAQ